MMALIFRIIMWCYWIVLYYERWFKYFNERRCAACYINPSGAVTNQRHHTVDVHWANSNTHCSKGFKKKRNADNFKDSSKRQSILSPFPVQPCVCVCVCEQETWLLTAAEEGAGYCRDPLISGQEVRTQRALLSHFNSPPSTCSSFSAL